MRLYSNNRLSRNLNSRLTNQQNRFNRISEDTLELRGGGGCISLFGLPFFGAGILMLLITVQLIRVSNAANMPFFVWIVLAFMGLIFTAVGGTLVFGRNWLVLDRNHRRIIKSWGLLKPLKQTEFDLDNYDTLLIRLHRGDSDTPDTYPLSLRTVTRNAELPLNSFQSYGTAVEEAEFLRDWLRFKVEDLSTDHPTSLQSVGEHDTSSDDFATPAQKQITPPQDMKCDITRDGDKLIITLPPRPLSLLDFIGNIIPLAFIFIVLLPFLSFFTSTGTPLPVQAFFGTFVGVFFFLIPLLSVLIRLSTARGSSQLTLTKQSIRMDYPRPKRSVTIALSDLIGLDYGTLDSALDPSNLSSQLSQSSSLSSQRSGSSSLQYSTLPSKLQWLRRIIPAKGLIFKTKRGFYYFGAGLPDHEIVYLHQELSRHLASLQ